MLRFSKQWPFFQGTILYIVLCVCVSLYVHLCGHLSMWAVHGHMHTWRSKTSPQIQIPPVVSAHKASPWQLRQNLSTWKHSISFFFYLFTLFCLIWFFAWTNFPTIIISNDNNLYSINYLYCTINSPRTDLQHRGAFFKVKLSTCNFCCVLILLKSLQTPDQSADSTPVLILISCAEIKQGIL